MENKLNFNEMEPVKLNPVFDDLINPDTIINHVDELQKKVEAEQKAKQNPFPIDVFPEPIQKIITATNESLNFPIDFIGASLLYAVSVAIGNTYRAEIMKGYEQNAVLYLAIVGLPGTNKTYPLKWALKPIEQRDNLKFEEYQKKKKEYESILALTKKEREGQGYSETIKPTWEQILVSDFTPEALVSVHSYNKRGLGVSVDELASWFKNFNRYNKGSEQEFWLSVWSGNTIKVNRKTSDQYNIPLPFISVAGTIQPGLLDELANNRTENGFLDRLLFVMPDNLKKEYWSETELPTLITDNWETIISNLLNISMIQDENSNPQPQTLRFTPEAKQILFEWQKELTDQSNKPENEFISGINAKIEMYVIRLALILQMMQYACNEGNKDAINTKAVQGAIKLAEYFKRTAIKVQNIVNNVNPLDKLPANKQNLYNELPDTFTTSEGQKIATSMKIPERTYKDFLSNKKLFIRIRQGKYEKKC